MAHQPLVERCTPDELVIGLMDLRGELVADCPDDFLGGHAKSSQEARALADAIALEPQKRQDAPDRETRATGLRIVVDDHHILASGGTEPLQPLLPFLPSARDLRLHVVVARPVAGASRALYDLVLQSLRDTGGSALGMSGSGARGRCSRGCTRST